MGSRGSSSGMRNGGGGGATGNTAAATTTVQKLDPTNWRTWQVGQAVIFSDDGDFVESGEGEVAFVANGDTYEGTVREVHDDHLLVSIPGVSDNMWVDDRFQDMYRAKTQSGTSSRSSSSNVTTTTYANASTRDIRNIYNNSEKGTVIEVRDAYGQYIGEMTKVGTRKWVGSQTQPSFYPAPRNVSSPSAMDFEIGSMNLTVKKKKNG